MRKETALAIALTACAASPSPVAVDAERERDFVRGDGGRVLVVDGRTGRAVPGARLRQFAEYVRDLGVATAPLIRTVRADEHGLAWIDASRWPRSSHWLVDAPGHAPTHEFGDVPPDVVELLPSRTFAFRLLDAAGRPIPDAHVEAYQGCPHAPALAAARSDAEGRVRLERVPSWFTPWVRSERSSAWTRSFPEVLTFVRGERAIVLSPGVVAEGVVVDLEGTPLAGVLVRATEEERGPEQVTGADGRFRLVGVRLRSALEFVHPAGDREPSAMEGDRWTPGIPRRVVLTPWEVVEPGGPRRIVRVRVTRADGSPVDGIPVRVVRPEDGWTLAAETDDDPRDDEIDDQEDAGESLFALPYGDYFVDRPTVFGEHELDGVAFTVGPGDGELLVPVRAVRRPQLVIEGEIPDGAAAVLAIDGAESEFGEEELAGAAPVHLPAAGAATLRVLAGSGTWFFPVGGEEAGTRTVRVVVPPPRILRGIDASAWDDVRLRDAFGECAFEETGAGLATWATGDLTLRFEATRRVAADDWLAYDVPVRVPAEGTSPIDVAAPTEDERRAREVVVRVESPEAVPARWEGSFKIVDAAGETIVESGTAAGTPVRFATPGGAWIHVFRDGWAPLRAEIDTPGEHVLRWGDAAVSLAARDDAGRPVPAALLFDGRVAAPAEDDGSSLVLRGLPAGPVEVVVLPEDPDLRRKALRIVLRQGEVRTREVVLVPR